MDDFNNKKPVLFYDGRNKHDIDYKMVELVFEARGVFLCVAAPIVRPGSYLEKQLELAKKDIGSAANDPDDLSRFQVGRELLLVDGTTGEVLTSNLERWYGTNDTSINGRYPTAANEMPELKSYS